MAEPKNLNELKSLILWSRNEKIPCNIIGAGSNLLINDDTQQGLSLCLRKLNGSEINNKSGLIEAFGGEPIPVYTNVQNGLGILASYNLQSELLVP